MIESNRKRALRVSLLALCLWASWCATISCASETRFIVIPEGQSTEAPTSALSTAEVLVPVSGDHQVHRSSGAKSATEAPVSVHKVHKHMNRRINITDRLHKFDLYIDPVCEQIINLTDKQLNKVFLQLREFSAQVS